MSFAKTDGQRVPDEDSISRALEILNRGKRIAILAGQGALGARDELVEIAELLGAPIVKALLGKGVVPDDHPLTTGGIGLLGTRASQEAFEECDTLLIVGSTFPYVEYYPKPRQARGVQIDRDASRIGLRFPVEAGLVGDARHTLKALIARAKAHADRTFLELAQRRKQEWTGLLQRSADAVRGRLTPDRLARDLGRRLADDAIVSWDSGHNTGVLARYVNARANQMFAGSGMLATMGCGVPYAIAAALAFPGRQVVTFVGDGGMTMLLGELATVVRYGAAHQDRRHEEQHAGPDQVGAAHVPRQSRIRMRAAAHRLRGRRARGSASREFAPRTDKDLEAGLDALFAASGPALLEALVDPNEPLLPPKRMPKYVENLEKALNRGTAGAEDIRAALEREPAHTQLS